MLISLILVFSEVRQPTAPRQPPGSAPPIVGMTVADPVILAQSIGFYAHDDMARLNLATERAAKHPAGKRNAELIKLVGQQVECILIAPSVTTVHANIKSSPVVDGDDHRRRLVRRRRHWQIGGLCSRAGRYKGGCNHNRTQHSLHGSTSLESKGLTAYHSSWRSAEASLVIAGGLEKILGGVAQKTLIAAAQWLKKSTLRSLCKMLTSPAYAKANVPRENGADDHVILASTETHCVMPELGKPEHSKFPPSKLSFLNALALLQALLSNCRRVGKPRQPKARSL